ncbi:unnamed protein product [Ixodes persulcatus]
MLAAAVLSALLALLAPASLAAPVQDPSWSPWSACRRCVQTRERPCLEASRCGSLVRETRTCPYRHCGPVRLRPARKATSRKQKQPGFKVLHHLQSLVYSDWSRWSPCTSECRTRRQRVCKMPMVCGKASLQEDALCYVRGSPCEVRYAADPAGSEEPPETVSGDSPLSCGVPRSSTRPALRIIGGRPAARGRWPWQVAVLNRRREPFCGGTLVSAGWVLTAAHCVRRRLIVLAGEHSLHRREGSEQEVRVSRTVLHPDYDPETVDMDLALLRLRSPLPMGAFVAPACLPEPGDTLAPGAMATILGWGKLNKRHANGSDLLHQAQVPVVPAQDCRDVYADYLISENMLCAGFRRGRVDSCAGDSGGPLLAKDRHGRWTIYGVTSFGEGCARQGRYGIYAKVENALRWIRRTIAENS